MSKPSRAVVTGGAGFIGSHIVDELIHRGVETIVIDNFTTGSPENLAQHEGSDLLRVIRGEVSQVKSLLNGTENIDVVFHEAAIASVPRSVSDPLLVHEVNVDASLQVMSYCVESRVRRMVFASSAAVYGALNGVEASESLPCSPSSPYGASKLAVEDYLAAFRNTYGLETVALRYFNVYGPRQTLNDYSGVVSVFTESLLNGTSPTIFGDGMQDRDFVHVEDVARANILAMDSDSASGQVFNVASGTSTSILNLYKTIQTVTGAVRVSPKFGPARRGDVKSGSASIAKIERLLGYHPELTLEEGLATFARWTATRRRAKELMA